MSMVSQGLGSPSTFGAGGGITISNQQLASYSLDTSEYTLASLDVDTTSFAVTAVIAGLPVALQETTTNHWEGMVYGRYIGVVTDETVYFMATDGIDAGGAVAGTLLNIVLSDMIISPDPLTTADQMVFTGWDKTKTNGIKPDVLAVTDRNQAGVKKFRFKDDTILIYEMNRGDLPKGTGHNHLKRRDLVTFEIHTNGTREHYGKLIDMLKHIIRTNRFNPPTYPLNATHAYNALYLEGDGNDQSDKRSGHFRFLQTARFMTYWEIISD